MSFALTTKAGTLIAAALLAAALAPAPANAQEPDRLWLACTPAFAALDPSFFPCVSRAENDDTIHLTGQGSFSPDGGTANGGGAFCHLDPAGMPIGCTAFEVTGLVSFVSFGTFPPGEQLGERGEGGLLILSVHIAVADLDGFLEIHCVVGEPPEGEFEGIRLIVPDEIAFDEALQGGTLFVPL